MNKYELNTILINRYKNFERDWYIDWLDREKCVIMPTCSNNLPELLKDYKTRVMCKYLTNLLNIKFLWLASFLIKQDNFTK